MKGCVCPGDILTYECTVMGEAASATVWTGSALVNDCDDIILLHDSRSYNGSGIYCNNGTIVARILYAEGNNYTSQLNITVTPDTVGKNIRCFYVNVPQTMLVFSSIIPTITGLSLS
jgi:hypothetical protein